MNDKLGLLAIIDEEFRRHPGMGPEDLRKLIVQSVFGGDHLLGDIERFRCDFLREWAEIGVGCPGGSAIQMIDPRGKTARVHLVACKQRDIDAISLVEALIAQPKKGGRQADFEARWRLVLRLAEEERLRFCPHELSNLAELEGLPHHSPGYGHASYRILHDVTDLKMADRLALWGLRR